MKQFIQFCCLGIAAAGLLLVPARQAVAQTAGDPAAVIALGSIDNQLADIKFLMEGSGQGAQYGMVQMMSAQFLKGFDRKRQIGGMLWFQEDNPQPKWIALVPVTNIDDVIDLVAQQMDVEENGDTYEIATPADETIYIREAMGYAVVSDDKSMLDMVPSNAGDLIGSVSPEFMAGARLYVQRIPEQLREMIISQIESGYRDQIEQMPDEDLADLQRANIDMQLARIRSMVNETEDLTIGLNVDQAARTIHLDLQMVGQSGSELARQSNNYSSAGPTKFGALLSDSAAMMMGMTAKVAQEDSAEARQMLDRLRSMLDKKMDEDEMPDDARAVAKNLVNSLFEVFQDTAEAGTMDAAAMVNLDGGLEIVGGAVAVNPARIEKSVQDAVREIGDQAADKAEFNLNKETFNGVRIHEIVVHLGDEEDAAKMFGSEDIRVLLGVGSDVVYLAMGKDPAASLKQAISGGSSGAESLPMQYSMHLAPVLRMAADMQGEEMPRMMAEKLSAGGRDRIRFNMKAIRNGFDMRFEAEDGILAIIGVAAQQMGGMMGGPGADF